MSQGGHRQGDAPAGERSYRRESSCGFHNTHQQWGELASYWTLTNPIRVNTLELTTSEALLAVLMHPQRPDLQREIADTPYPTLAKRIGESVAPSHEDWEHKRVQAMRLCLRLKVQTNHAAIAKVLKDTATSDIVQISGYDTFWGTRPTRDGRLIGHNVPRTIVDGAAPAARREPSARAPRAPQPGVHRHQRTDQAPATPNWTRREITTRKKNTQNNRQREWTVNESVNGNITGTRVVCVPARAVERKAHRTSPTIKYMGKTECRHSR